MNFRSLLPVAVACLGAGAQAQLVFGTTGKTATLPTAYYMDVTTGAVSGLYNYTLNKKVNGIVADRSSGKIYSNDAARLNVWNYGAVGTAPTFIGGFYRWDPAISAAPVVTGIDDLTWAKGKMYGWNAFANAGYKRGIYEIPTSADSTGKVVMTNEIWKDTTGLFTFQGLAYDPVRNVFYGANNNAAAGQGVGLYKIEAFGSGAVTWMGAFPAGRTGIDGLVVGDDGNLWMTEKDRTNDNLYVFSMKIATGAFGASYTFNYPDHTTAGGPTVLATGATWAPFAAVPEPGSLLAMGLGALVLIRRRRA